MKKGPPLHQTRMGFKFVDTLGPVGKRDEVLLDAVVVVVVLVAQTVAPMDCQTDLTEVWRRGWDCERWINCCYIMR